MVLILYPTVNIFPMVGYSTRHSDEEMKIYQSVLKKFSLTPDSFHNDNFGPERRINGGKRQIVVIPENLSYSIEQNEDSKSVLLNFILPSGAYASTLVRELCS
eukprot:UN06833